MTASILAAKRSERALLENLFQFYCYDFSEIVGGNVGFDGRFSPPPIDAYWQDPWRYPYIVRVDDVPAGFALIHRRSRITQDPDTWDVAEFFVMRPYRRKGTGSYAALQLFDRFRGRWEVRQVGANTAATVFWRAVIAGHTNGRFIETIHDDERWRGPVQTFDNTAF
jgi:predicted acetyltransferase